MQSAQEDLERIMANKRTGKIIREYLAIIARVRAERLGQKRCAEIASMGGLAAKAKRAK